MLLCSEGKFKDAEIAPYFETAITKMQSDLKTKKGNMDSRKLGYVIFFGTCGVLITTTEFRQKKKPPGAAPK